MFRIEGLFAMTGVAFAGLGLALSRLLPHLGITLGRPANLMGLNAGHRAFELGTPCYGLAAMFCFFACFYSMGCLSHYRVAAEWHLILSWAGVLLFAIGIASLSAEGRSIAEKARSGQAIEIPLTSAVGFSLGPAVFLLGQALFVISLIADVVRLRRG